MTERSFVARLRAEASQFIATMAQSKKAAEGVGQGAEKAAKQADSAFSRMAKNVQANSAHIDRLGNTALVAGGAIAAGLGVGVKAFADFDEAMSSVNAALPEAAAQMGRLRQLAIDLGKDSQFSSTEAAEGITELAKAGVDANAILGGGLKGSLDLAASGQLEVAEAAEIAATAMVQFKRDGSDVPHIADLLAAGAGKAQGSVADLGMALNQAGLVAAGMGVTLEETTGTLAAFASAGLVGSDAGTSFKTMIQRLQAPVGDAALMLDKLKISAYDGQGNFVGLANVAGQLQDRMKEMTPEVRNNALAVIFGSDAVRAANVLYEQGATGIAKWTGAVNDAGFASEQAAALTDNLKGDIERLGGALDAVFVQNGEGVNGALRGIVQNVEGAVEAFGSLPAPAQQGALALAGLTGASLLAVGAFAKAVTAGADLAESLEVIRDRAPRAAKGLDATTKAAKGLFVVAATLAAGGVLDSIFGPDRGRPGTEVLTRDLSAADDAVEAFSDRMRQFADESSNWWSSNQVTSFGDALHDVFDPTTFQQIDNAAGALTSFFGMDNNSDIANAAAAMQDLDRELSGLVSSGNTAEAARQFNQFAMYAEANGVSVDQLKTKLPGYAEALAALGNEQTRAASTSGKVSGGLDDVGEAAEQAQEKVEDAADAIRDLGKGTIDLEEAEANMRDSMDAAIKTAEATAKAVKDGELTKAQAARENAGALRDAATDAKEYAATTREITGDATKARDAMQTGRDEFIKTAIEMGKTKKEAKELADRYGLIPENVTTTVGQKGAEQARATVQELILALEALNSKTVTVGVRYVYSGVRPGGGRSLGGGLTIDADGGMHVGGPHGLVKAYADGGMWDGSLRQAQPQIARAGGRGILWAEEGAGPWEAFISGHPAKLPRSRMIAEDTVSRLGGRIDWRQFAAGGFAVGDGASGPVDRSQDNRLIVEQLVTTAENGRQLQRDLMRRRRYSANRGAS